MLGRERSEKEPTSRMTRSVPRLACAVAISATLFACTQTVPGAGSAAGDGHVTVLVTDPAERPADARPGACYGKDVTPAVIEVVTEDILIEPAKFAPDGAVIKPAVYETSTRQDIVKPRREVFFEVPCPAQMTPEFIASLQRALQARGYYAGPITGQMDEPTRRAVRAYQLPSGLNTDILTLETALELGLVAYGSADAG